MPKLPLTVLCLCGAVFATGCGSLPDTPTANSTAVAERVAQSAKPDQNLYENLTGASDLLTQWRLVNRSGLDETLSGKRELTLLAPDNNAYQHMPRWAFARLWVEVNRERVKNLIGFQILPGRYDARRLKRLADKGDRIVTLEGEKIIPRHSGSELSLEDVYGRQLGVIKTNVEASNGVMHVLSGIPVPGAYP